MEEHFVENRATMQVLDLFMLVNVKVSSVAQCGDDTALNLKDHESENP